MVKKKKKKRQVRKKGIKCLLITGCKNSKWPTQSFVNKYIGKLAKDGYKEEGYVITGASRETERKIVRACKESNVRCIIVPANFASHGGANAEQIRNAEVLQNFKPEGVTIFSLKPIDEDSTLEYLKKLVIRKMPWALSEITKGE